MCGCIGILWIFSPFLVIIIFVGVLSKCCGIGELPNLLTLLDFLIHIALVIFAVLTLADAYAG